MGAVNMKIITTAVIKGGTGKTTTAAAIAQAAAAEGYNVLAIDLDAQCNLTRSLNAKTTERGSYEILHGTAAEEAIQNTTQNIDVLAARAELATEKTRPGSAARLYTSLKGVKNRYDYIIIDTPPTMGELTYNALLAATDVIIPIEADSASIQGLYNIVDIINQLQPYNKRLKHVDVIITRYDSRPKLTRYLKDKIIETCKDINITYLIEVRNGIAVKEAQALQVSLFEYAPRSKPAQDYKKLFNLIK